LKAIHNVLFVGAISCIVVVQRAKIQNWKQFTTRSKFSNFAIMLLFKEQRYKIESNSQQDGRAPSTPCRCCSKSKDTKLKAIHNYFDVLVSSFRVVVQRAKIQNWKQFTTNSTLLSEHNRLLFKEQRYKIESNSQLISITYHISDCCCSKSKDTKLKAIHNENTKCEESLLVVVQRAKIQNWKQFTTPHSQVFASF